MGDKEKGDMEKIVKNARKVLEIIERNKKKESKRKNQKKMVRIEEMVSINSQVYSEVYDIIYHMDEQLFNKIPKEFIKMIEQSKDENFVVKIDYSKSINDQELQRGTRVILSLIYRDYLCSEEQRKVLIKKDEEELERIEKELRGKYNPDNMFKRYYEKTEEKIENQNSMIVYNETIFQKILKKLKKWFRLS